MNNYFNLEGEKKCFYHHIIMSFIRRGFSEEEAIRIINKTNFIEVLNEYPEFQIKNGVKHTVDQIIIKAALS